MMFACSVLMFHIPIILLEFCILMYILFYSILFYSILFYCVLFYCVLTVSEAIKYQEGLSWKYPDFIAQI